MNSFYYCFFLITDDKSFTLLCVLNPLTIRLKLLLIPFSINLLPSQKIPMANEIPKSKSCINIQNNDNNNQVIYPFPEVHKLRFLLSL